MWTWRAIDCLGISASEKQWMWCGGEKFVCFDTFDIVPIDLYLKPENCADAMHRKSSSFFNAKEGSAFHTLPWLIMTFNLFFISRLQLTQNNWLFHYNIFDIWFIYLDWVQERKLLKYVQNRMFILWKYYYCGLEFLPELRMVLHERC